MTMLLNYKYLIGVFFLNFLFIFSCSEEIEQNNYNNVGVYDQEIDTSFCNLLGQNLIGSLQIEDSVSFTNQLHLDEFYKRNVLKNQNSEEVQKLINKFCQRYINLYSELNEVLKLSGRVDFISSSKKKNNFSILFRGYVPPQEVTFWEVVISGTRRNLILEDVVSYRYGSSYSEICKLLQLKAEQNIEQSAKIKSLESLSHLDSSQYFNYRSKVILAWEELAKIDPLYDDLPVINYQKFQLATYTSEEVRQQVLFAWLTKLDKKLPAYWLYYFYYEATNGNYGNARIALVNLEESVGNDPFLGYLKGVTFFEEFQYDKALEIYSSVLGQIKDVPDVHFAKIICLVEKKEYVEAVESIMVMEDYFEISGVNWDREFVGYPEFLASDEFSKFLERIEDPI